MSRIHPQPKNAPANGGMAAWKATLRGHKKKGSPKAPHIRSEEHTSELHTLALHDALPISCPGYTRNPRMPPRMGAWQPGRLLYGGTRKRGARRLPIFQTGPGSS